MRVAILYFVPPASKSRRSREIDPQRPAVAAAGDLDLAIRAARMVHRGQKLAPVLERADRAAAVARASLTRNRAIVGVKTANARAYRSMTPYRPRKCRQVRIGPDRAVGRSLGLSRRRQFLRVRRRQHHVDDCGYADLGCTGQTDYQTPALDRLAAEGIRFTPDPRQKTPR